MANDKDKKQATARSGPHTAVVGLGAVGSVTAAALAQAGLLVSVYDRDAIKLDQVRAGQSPVTEPGLADLIQKGLKNQALRVASNLRECLVGAETVILCVGSGAGDDGRPDLSDLRRIWLECLELVRGLAQPRTFAIRTPLYPGAVAEHLLPLVPAGAPARIVVTPAFLRRGSVVNDFFESKMVVCGSSHSAAAIQVADLFAKAGLRPEVTSLAVAELLGQTCGAFHATKVAFANEVAALCQKLGVPAMEVMGLLAKDTLLNSSSAYLQPGLAFSGPNLPRRVQSMVVDVERTGLRAPLLASLLESNDAHAQRVLEELRGIPAERIGLFGITYRPDTDDVRGSFALKMLQDLIHLDRSVRLFDPAVQYENLHGENWRTLLMELPLAERVMTNNFDELLAWCQCLVVANRPDKAFAAKIAASRVPILNLSGAPLEA